MIVYDPFWQTMKERGFTTYTLREKFGVGNRTVQRLRKNEPVNTSTLDKLCEILDCTLPEVAEYRKNRP